MIADEMAHERLPLSFHDDPHFEVHPQLVLIAVDLFEPVADREAPCAQRRKEAL